MLREEIRFKNDGHTFAGTLHLPDDPGPHPAMIVLHAASGGERSYPFYQHLLETFPGQGLVVFTYDRRGSGASEGDYTTADFETLAADASSAVRSLRNHIEIQPDNIGLFGVSQGGWIAPILAAKDPDLAFLIIVSGSAVTPAEQMDYAAAYNLREAGYSGDVVAYALELRDLVDGYFRGNIDRELILSEIRKAEHEPWFENAFLRNSQRLPEDLSTEKWYYELDYDPIPVWQGVTQPVLFLFGERDRWVPVAESRAIYRKATGHIGDISIKTFPELDHLMREADQKHEVGVSQKYLKVLIAWLAARVNRKV